MDEIPAWAMDAAWEVWKHIRFPAKIDDGEHVQHIAHALVAERERAAAWLNSMPQNWELVCENEDRSDLSSDLVWAVYEVTGGLNDREWRTLGTGDTPSNALSAAFVAAAMRTAIRKGE